MKIISRDALSDALEAPSSAVALFPPQEDLSSEDHLDLLDALVKLLDVLHCQGSPMEFIDLRLESHRRW